MTQLRVGIKAPQSTGGSAARSAALSQVVGTGFMVLFLFLICATIFYVCGPTWRGFLIAINASIMLVPVIFRLWQGTFDLFEPLLMADLAMMGMYVGRPVADVLTNHFHEGTYDITTTWDTALLLVTLANLALQIGYALPIGRSLLDRYPKRAPLFRTKVAIWWASFISVLGVVLFGVFLRSLGGIGTLFIMVNGRTSEGVGKGDAFATSTAYLYDGYHLLVPSATLMFGLFLTTKRRIYLFLSLSLLAPYMIMQIGGGNRSGIIGLLFGIPMLWYIWRGKRPNLLSLAVGGLLVAFFFSFLRDYRQVQNRGSHQLNSYTANPVETVLQLFTTDDDEMFDVVGEIIAVTPGWVHFRPFGVVTDILVRAIPRTLWPDKPIEMSELMFATLEPNRFSHSRAGTAPSLVGDFYLDSGFISVIFWMFVLGAVLRTLWEWLLRNQKSIVVLMIFSTVPGAIIYTLRGNLAGYLGLAFFTSFPLVLFAIIQRFDLRLRHSAR